MKMNVADVIAPEYLDLAREMIAHKAAEHVSTVYEIDIISKSGRRVRLEVSTRLIFRDGKPVGVQGIARDLTERKHSEEALRETQAFFNSFMDNSPAVAFMKDHTGRYVYVNKPFERLFGQKLSFLKGRMSFDWLPPETAATDSRTRSKSSQQRTSGRDYRNGSDPGRHAASLARLQVSRLSTPRATNTSRVSVWTSANAVALKRHWPNRRNVRA